MDNPSWDDGSLAPVFIRLAWHSSGTFDKATATIKSNTAVGLDACELIFVQRSPGEGETGMGKANAVIQSGSQTVNQPST